MRQEALKPVDEKVWLAFHKNSSDITPELVGEAWSRARPEQKPGHRTAVDAAVDILSKPGRARASEKGQNTVLEALMEREGLTPGQVLDSLVRSLHQRGGLPLPAHRDASRAN